MQAMVSTADAILSSVFEVPLLNHLLNHILNHLLNHILNLPVVHLMSLLLFNLFIDLRRYSGDPQLLGK